MLLATQINCIFILMAKKSQNKKKLITSYVNYAVKSVKVPRVCFDWFPFQPLKKET